MLNIAKHQSINIILLYNEIRNNLILKINISIIDYRYNFDEAKKRLKQTNTNAV